MRIPESELIINSDGSVFHIHIRPDQLADKVILVGDPGRVEMFRPLLEKVECEGASREFVWITGRYNSERVTVLSTGIGTDNIDIVMTELDALANVDFTTREVKPEHRTLDILRIGTCGAIQPEIPLGAFIFSHISVGCDGLLNWYDNRDQIALLDFEEAFRPMLDAKLTEAFGKISDVKDYLHQFLSDQRVIEANPLMWKFILNCFKKFFCYF